MEKYDLIIVGAGPAGIFTAVELLRHGSKKKMLLVEKGKPVEKRHCPKAEVGHCVNCRPTCAITTGFSGAGAFSDGKLSLSYEVGGDLPTLIGEEFAQELIDYTDKIYLEFGADPHVEGIYTGEEIKEIRKNAIHAGLKLVDCPIRHLGTEKAQQLYLAIQNYLADNGVEMLFNTECENIILENEECKGVLLKDGDQVRPVYADTVVIGTGRRGADWLEKICAEHHIAHKPGTVDIGVRVECRNEVMEKVNKVLYESKLIGYPKPWKNKVRTFCQNPGGFVAQENYDNDLAVVNGHSFKEKEEPEHQPCHSGVPQLYRALQPAHRLRTEGGRADQHAGRRPHHGAALRRHSGRQAHLAEGAGPVQREAHPEGCRGRRHHRRHALPRHDQHH